MAYLADILDGRGNYIFTGYTYAVSIERARVLLDRKYAGLKIVNVRVA